MKIQACVFNWAGQEQSAKALEQQLRELCPVEVVNTDPTVESRHPSWHHLGSDAYFTALWNRALDLFDADVLLNVQADASFTRFGEMLERCRFAMREHGCGVYAPNVDYTPWTYRRGRLKAIDADLFEVGQTDGICWAIARDVLQRTPRLDPKINKFGWGIDWVTIAAARQLGKKVVRDYRFTVAHPHKTGYDKEKAQRQFETVLETLPDDLRELVQSLRREAEHARTYTLGGRVSSVLQQLKWLAGWR